MKKSEKPASKETSLDDSIQLAIRDEVEKRVEQREALYWKFGGLLAVVIALFFTFLWKVSVSEIRETVEKQLAEKEVVKARDRIMSINSAAEDVNRNLTSISSSMNTNQQQFLERLNQIKQQDDVLLTGDLSKLFIIQIVTNLVNGKIILDYQPIPQTIKIIIHPAYFFPLDLVGSLEGNTIVFSKTGLGLTNQTPNGVIKVEYMRKSLH